MAEESTSEVTRDLNRLASLEQHYNATYDHYVQQFPEGPIRAALMGAVHSSAVKYLDIARNEYGRALLRGDRKQAEQIRVQSLDPLFRTHRARVESLESMAEGGIKAQETAAVAEVNSRMEILLLVGLTAAALCSLLGWLIFTMVGRPVRKMEEAARQLADGNVDVELASHSNDEIGRLAQSFQKMAQMIKARVSAAERIAAGDLSVQIEAASEHDVLAGSLSLVVHNLKHLMNEMEQMSALHAAGQTEAAIDTSNFQGAYRKVAAGVNQMVAEHMAVTVKSMHCVAEFGNGNFAAELEQFPGKRARFNEIVEQVRSNLVGLIQEIESMSQAHRLGEIEARIDADKFQGDFKRVADGINEMVAEHIRTISKAVQCMSEFGQGNFEAELERFPGKRAFVNEIMEQVRTRLRELISDVNVLVEAALVGNLDVRVDPAAHAGDFRKIVQGINKTLDAVINPIKDVETALGRLSDGDFTVEIDRNYTGEFNSLKDAVNTMARQVSTTLKGIGDSIGSLAASSQQLGQLSQQMSASANQTASQANVVSSAIEQVSTNVQTVATGTDEMGASIKEIARSASEATAIADSAAQLARSTNQTVNELGASSKRIGAVIKLINSIAQQTNLLALNATIEAARAGEAGKGFTVVASEVKQLANQTATATKEIGQKIQAIQEEIKGTVGGIGQITEVIGQVNNIQTTIASAVEEQSATTNEMTRNMSEAATGSREITANIAGVAQAARSTLQAASETQQSATSLAAMATQLKALVGHFSYERANVSVGYK
jgi:methyl-accepting chemotaxis protein